jgi:hypothetical protein
VDNKRLLASWSPVGYSLDLHLLQRDALYLPR